jgi:pyruvate kinase
MRRTKIIATLGPACASSEVVRELLNVPVDVFRINASHGSHSGHQAQIAMVRRLSAEVHSYAGVLFDLQGPKIRLGRFDGGTATLSSGSTFTITTDKVIGDAFRASTDYSSLAADLSAGDRLVLADGAVELHALEIASTAVVCVVTSGGTVRDHQGINLPNVKLSTPSLTEKDLCDVEFAVEQKVDFVALSFVRSASDIVDLRHILAEKAWRVPIIAKIERPEACENLDAIMQAADGVMVARGDLGVEMSLARVPALQKKILDRSRRLGKFAVVATQMLESMTSNRAPTRAEVSDVATGVYDGADALMLSAETATGAYPVNSARMMANIALETEGADTHLPIASAPNQESSDHAHIAADACCRAAQAPQIEAIVVFTTTGATARLIARCRPSVPIFAFAPTDDIVRSLSIVYGVRAFRGVDGESTRAMIEATDGILMRSGFLARGSGVVVSAGEPIGKPGSTNQIRLHRVGLAPGEDCGSLSSIETSSEHQSEVAQT